MMLKYFAFGILFFLFSCGNKNPLPSGILKPDKMQTVLWDVIRADAFTFDFIKKDSTKNLEAENVKLQQQIFAMHKITKDEFYKSYKYYTTHPNLMQPILDSLISRANKDKYSSTKGRPLLDTLKAK